MRRNRILAAATATLLLAGTGAAASDGDASDGGAARGETLYATYCTQCHGLDGQGDGINAAALTVQPRNHTDRVEMSARTDADLIKAIKHGGKSVNKSVLMPAWEAVLDDDEINALVAHLRRLCCTEP